MSHGYHVQGDYLSPDVIRAGADGLLHGGEAEDLQEVVLHHISDYSKLVKVSTTSLCSEGFLESNLDTGNAISVPSRSKYHVPEPEADEVLHHLLAEVVVYPV